MNFCALHKSADITEMHKIIKNMENARSPMNSKICTYKTNYVLEYVLVKFNKIAIHNRKSSSFTPFEVTT